MMMPSPTLCSVEKPHNSSKKILFPEKTTRSANAIRFHCRSLTVSHCIKGKAFLKTRHMSRPDHSVGQKPWRGGRKKSFIKSKSVTQISHCGVQHVELSQQTHTMQWRIQSYTHTVIHMSHCGVQHVTQLRPLLTYVTQWYTVIHSDTYVTQLRPLLTYFPIIIRSRKPEKPILGKRGLNGHFPNVILALFLQLSNFTNNYRGNAVSQLSLNTSFFIQNTD